MMVVRFGRRSIGFTLRRATVGGGPEARTGTHNGSLSRTT